MEKGIFLTITGTGYYYGMKPFEVGRVVRLVKEPDNEHDGEAIRAELPYIGKIGYAANSTHTVAKGTCSAGRVYDLFGKEASAQVLFVTHASVICLLLPPEDTGSGPDEASAREPDASTETAAPAAQYKKKKFKIGFRA